MKHFLGVGRMGKCDVYVNHVILNWISWSLKMDLSWRLLQITVWIYSGRSSWWRWNTHLMSSAPPDAPLQHHWQHEDAPCLWSGSAVWRRADTEGRTMITAPSFSNTTTSVQLLADLNLKETKEVHLAAAAAPRGHEDIGSERRTRCPASTC